jgi:DNA/RNA endonuclease YhcR with UshA esterase domain
MITDRLFPNSFLGRTCPLLCALMICSTACVGFINGDDGSDEAGDGDGDTGEGDGDGDPGDVTIQAIQQGEIGEGMIVTVSGVIVTSSVNIEEGLAFIEEPGGGEYSGIALYLWSEVVMSTPLAPGDVVDVTGEYTEHFGLSQLIVKNPGDITVVGTDAVPGPDIVTASEVARDNPDAEPWEGVRVQIVDAVIAEANDGFGQYLLQGGTLVGNEFVDPLPQVHVGGVFSSVTGALYYSFEEFKLQPNSAADLAGYQSPQPMEDTPIYDIQSDMVSIGTIVMLEGVVASSGFTWSADPEASFFVQEPAGGARSGIQVFVADTSGLTIAPGDELTIVGTYDEYFDMSQIEVANASGVTKTGSVSAPTPELIADPASITTSGAAAEDYEGVLVRVENVMVTDINPDDPEDFGEFAVTGDLRVDDVFFAMADWTKPALGTSFAAITGPLIYGFSNFKLAPRDAADLEAN